MGRSGDRPITAGPTAWQDRPLVAARSAVSAAPRAQHQAPAPWTLSTAVHSKPRAKHVARDGRSEANYSLARAPPRFARSPAAPTDRPVKELLRLRRGPMYWAPRWTRSRPADDPGPDSAPAA